MIVYREPCHEPWVWQRFVHLTFSDFSNVTLLLFVYLNRHCLLLVYVHCIIVVVAVSSASTTAGVRELMRREHAPSTRSLMIGEEVKREKRQATGLGQCFVFPSVLWHWWLGGRKDIQPIKTHSVNSERFSSWTGGGGGLNRNQLTHVHLEQWPLNGSSCSDGCVIIVVRAQGYV